MALDLPLRPVAFALLILALFPWRAHADEADAFFDKGVQALKDTQADADAVLDAARAFTKAAQLYDAKGNVARTVETNSYLYWCKKKMTLEQVESFVKLGENDTAKALEKVVRTEAPADGAREMLKRAADFASKNPDEHFLIAIRFFEVADRFKGSDISIEAQDRSLKEQQKSLTSGPHVPRVKLPVAKAALPAGRQAVPATAKVSTAQKGIREIYRTEYAQAAAEPQIALAEKLLGQAAGETDSATRFALFREVIELAARAGSNTLAVRAIDALARSFDADALDEIFEVLSRPRPGKLEAAQARAVVTELQRAGERALVSESYQKIPRFTGLAKAYTTRITDKALCGELQSWAREFDDIAREWTPAAKAAEKLAASPNDASANLAIGRFYLFYRNDVERSLPALARGSDEKLKALALHELARPTEAARMATLAEDWLAYIQKQGDPVRIRAVQRAVFWQQKAIPELAGIERVRLEKRLSELEPFLAGVVTAAEGGTAKPVLHLRPRTPIQVEIYAACDDHGLICLNGQDVLHAGGKKSTSATILVQRGDVIAVEATDDQLGFGFACVIKSKLGFAIASNRTEWHSYKPASKEEWWIVPESAATKGADRGSSAVETEAVIKASGVTCEGIWPAGVGGKATGYMYLVIGEDSFKPY